MSQGSTNRRRHRATHLAVMLWMVCVVGVSSLAAQDSASTHPVDLISATRDLNGLLLNPTWRQSGPRDVAQECGFLAGPGQPGYRALIVRDSNCYANYADSNTVLRMVEPRDSRVGGVACLQGNHDGLMGGHVNWDAVTMTGSVDWLGLAEDGDLNFVLHPDTAVALTVGNVKEGGGIELEFNAYETLMRMLSVRGRWWSRVRAFAENPPADTVPFHGLRAIVTGVFGVDGVHEAPVELHPVFALFLRVRADTSHHGHRERWAFFVRNLGDEGMCSYGQAPFVLAPDVGGTFVYHVLIPAPADADSVWLNWGGMHSWVATTSPAAGGPYFRTDGHRDVEVTLRLPTPYPSHSDALIYGEFELGWRVPIATVAAQPELQDSLHRKHERRPEDRLKVPKQRNVTGFCADTSFDIAHALGLVRTHWRSCIHELPGTPPHDTILRPPPLDSIPRRPLQPVPTWSDNPAVVVCGDPRVPTGPSCRGLHHLEVAAGFLVHPNGPHFSSISLAPIEIEPGEWRLPAPATFLSNLLGLRPVLTADWYTAADTSGTTYTTTLGSVGLRTFGSVHVPWSPAAFRAELSTGPALFATKDTAAVSVGWGWAFYGGVRAGLGDGGLTIGTRLMLRHGRPHTWAVLAGSFLRAPW